MTAPTAEGPAAREQAKETRLLWSHPDGSTIEAVALNNTIAAAREEGHKAACAEIAERMHAGHSEKPVRYQRLLPPAPSGSMFGPEYIEGWEGAEGAWEESVRAFGQTGRWPDSREGGEENP